MTRLRLSHYMPPDHGTHVDLLEPWARRVEAACPTLKIDIYCGGSKYGLLEKQFDQVVSGEVDIAHSPTTLPPGRFPLTHTMSLPFLVGNAGEAARRLWQAHDRFLAAEFAPLHVLALHADSGGILHLRDRPLSSMEDLAGLRIRTPAGALSRVVAALGAEPVHLLPPAIGPAARAGEIDAAIMAWDVLIYTGTQDIFRHHHPEVFYVSPLYLVMNPRSRASLTEEERTTLDRLSGADLAPRFGDYWENWSRPGRLVAEAPDHTLQPLPASVLAIFREAAISRRQDEISRLVDMGLSTAPDVLTAFEGGD